MLTTIAWRNVRANPVRFLGTVLAVVLATTFLSAALTARDSLSDSLVSNAVSALDQVDLAVEGVVDESADAIFLPPPGVPVEVVDQVADVNGVDAVVGEVAGLVEVDDSDDLTRSLTGWVVTDSPLSPWTIEEGVVPTASGEIALDGDIAAAIDATIGDAVTVATTSGPLEVTVVGISSFGDQAARDTADMLVSPADGDIVAGLSADGWDTVLIDLADDADEAVAAAAVNTIVESAGSDDLEVISGDDLRDREAGAAAGLASGLGIGLQAFAYLALVIGALIIFNTFTTVVAQRTREFALLRAIGTSARQVRRAVRLEALVIAVAASAIGVLLGAGLVAAAIAFIPAVGNFADFSLSPWSVVQVMLSGIIVTMISAFIPAWKASRTRPVEAMRDADPTIKSASRTRGLIGLGALVIGGLALGIGSIASNWWAMGAGAVLLFLGVLVGGPTVVAWLARVVRGPLARLSIADELAVAETERNARRTAATANALVIGVFLVVFTTSAGGALRDFAIEQIGQFSGSDLSVASFTGEPLSDEVVEEIVAVEGLDGATRLGSILGTVGIDTGFGGDLPIGGVDTDSLDVLGLEVAEGDPTADGLLLASELAEAASVTLGDLVEVEFLDGATVELEVVALTGFSFDAPPAVIDLGLAEELIGDEAPIDGVAVRFSPDANQDQVRLDMEEVTDQYAGVELIDANQFVSLIRTFFNFLLSAVAALLGVAVVIALFGILNTLVLAIAERTRELGLLRAVGMSRTQLRRMIRTEAMITSIVGTTIGAAMGLAVAFAVTRVALEGAFTWPLIEIGFTMVAGVVTGVLASLYPARRAAKMDVLEAIRTQ